MRELPPSGVTQMMQAWVFLVHTTEGKHIDRDTCFSGKVYLIETDEEYDNLSKDYVIRHSGGYIFAIKDKPFTDIYLIDNKVAQRKGMWMEEINREINNVLFFIRNGDPYKDALERYSIEEIVVYLAGELYGKAYVDNIEYREP